MYICKLFGILFFLFRICLARSFDVQMLISKFNYSFILSFCVEWLSDLFNSSTFIERVFSF